MSDLIKEYTVSEIVKGIKNTLEKEYFYIKIKGEISNFKSHPSGHYYFSLKDEESMINVVMFRQYAEYCKIDLDNGLEVVAAGKLTIYKERSNYQLLAETIQLNGVGGLLKLIQDRKEKLAKEGLFDQSRKRPIPKMPGTVGLITAESGAAIHDILSRLENRTPISIMLYSVLMQGKEAPAEIISAINYFNNLKEEDRPQVLVITRGGGSIEDLMAFNDEDLVRAVAASKIPTISAVGHEVDWTLIDYASDLRLPTPTSVAEYLTISKEQAWINLKNLTIRMYAALANSNISKANRLALVFSNFIVKKCEKITKFNFMIKSFEIRLASLFTLKIEKYKRKFSLLKKIDVNKIIKNKLNQIAEKIKLFDLKLNYYRDKFPILKDTLGHKITSKQDVMLGKNYILEFADGNVKVKIVKV